jgi:hypothetical protein
VSADVNFQLIEDFANGARPEHQEVHIHREDDGHISLVFGGSVPVTEIIAALAELPQDAAYDDSFTRYSEYEDCEGSDEPDEEHFYPVVTMSFYVPEAES